MKIRKKYRNLLETHTCSLTTWFSMFVPGAAQHTPCCPAMLNMQLDMDSRKQAEHEEPLGRLTFSQMPKWQDATDSATAAS